MIIASNGLPALDCFNLTTVTAPDGHNAFNDAITNSQDLRVTSVSPPPGTLVDQKEPITLHGNTIDSNEPPVFRPCDWVTTDEAASIFDGGPVVSALPMGDQAGSVRQTCTYNIGSDDVVTSTLSVAGSFAIDATAELGLMRTNPGSQHVSNLGVDAYCSTTTSARGTDAGSLTVLLSGDRIYQADFESCDVLVRFANVATRRIGA